MNISDFKKMITNVDRIKKTSIANFVHPMLATLTHNYFSDSNWLYERKLDGERCIVIKKGRSVKIISRNKKLLNDYYPDLVEEIKKQKISFIIDCEIIAKDKKLSSFAKLQQRMKKKVKSIDDIPFRVYLYVFDLLHIDGYNICKLPLVDRKKLLKKYIKFSSPYFCYTQHITKEGKQYYKQACKKHWEGVIAKKMDSTYRPQQRSKDWLKFKCSASQELIIVGFKYYKNSKDKIGALLLGYYKDSKLCYAGKVGTGFDDKLRAELFQKLNKIQIKKQPFENGGKDTDNAQWVKAKLVAEIEFTEWTSSNKLRHPRFKGLRDDKPAKKVVKEG